MRLHSTELDKLIWPPLEVDELINKVIGESINNDEVIEGWRASLEFRINGVEIQVPYEVGTAQAKRFHYGVERGNKHYENIMRERATLSDIYNSRAELCARRAALSESSFEKKKKEGRIGFWYNLRMFLLNCLLLLPWILVTLAAVYLKEEGYPILSLAVIIGFMVLLAAKSR